MESEVIAASCLFRAVKWGAFTTTTMSASKLTSSTARKLRRRSSLYLRISGQYLLPSPSYREPGDDAYGHLSVPRPPFCTSNLELGMKHPLESDSFSLSTHNVSHSVRRSNEELWKDKWGPTIDSNSKFRSEKRIPTTLSGLRITNSRLKGV